MKPINLKNCLTHIQFNSLTKGSVMFLKQLGTVVFFLVNVIQTCASFGDILGFKQQQLLHIILNTSTCLAIRG